MTLYRAIYTNGDNERIELVEADDEVEASEILEGRQYSFKTIPKDYHLISLKLNQRGGTRPGAGRKPTGEPSKTVVRRLDRELAERWDTLKPKERNALPELLEILKEWQDRANHASPSSPRWEKLRELLRDVDDILNN